MRTTGFVPRRAWTCTGCNSTRYRGGAVDVSPTAQDQCIWGLQSPPECLFTRVGLLLVPAAAVASWIACLEPKPHRLQGPPMTGFCATFWQVDDAELLVVGRVGKPGWKFGQGRFFALIVATVVADFNMRHPVALCWPTRLRAEWSHRACCDCHNF